MSHQTYKRGQIEWALWRSVRPLGSRDDGPPTIFRTRIKRLLDLDRELDQSELPSKAASNFAFVTAFEGGSGIEAAYTAADVFAVALALDLLDVGFKQGEIVFVMRHLRADLESWYRKLIKRPSLLDRQRHLAKDHRNLPILPDRAGKAPVADARVFLILNRIEMTEVLSVKPHGKAGQAVFLEPKICEGISGLQTCLDDLMPLHRRTVIALEIAFIAQAVTIYLTDAPAVPRGRPRRKA